MLAQRPNSFASSDDWLYLTNMHTEKDFHATLIIFFVQKFQESF